MAAPLLAVAIVVALPILLPLGLVAALTSAKFTNWAPDYEADEDRTPTRLNANRDIPVRVGLSRSARMSAAVRPST